ncbi:Arginase/deacetylase, partial [Caulochytrium protostelioides]
PGRSSYVHSLVHAYGLDRALHILPAIPASDAQLRQFHRDDYVAFTQYRRDVERFNLSNDCPVFAGMEAYVRWVAGSTILAARHLLYSDFDVVINWDGGRHHSKAAEASGFCYVNDIVLGINELLTHHDRVLYVDLDIHHGDGVEAAYRQSDRVMTVSFHRYDGQFFPKTGHTAEHGVGRGAGFALNVPLRSGLRGEALVPFYTTVMDEVLAAFRPGAIVIQCGADGMAGDPLGGKWNLDMISYTKCVMHLVNQNRPALVLGGGGYSRTICARTWTFLTAAILD